LNDFGVSSENDLFWTFSADYLALYSFFIPTIAFVAFVVAIGLVPAIF